MITNKIAIIGAGCSGLSAAHILRDAGKQVTIFEKSRSVGGRAATRRHEGFIFDNGAQYIKGDTKIVTERFKVPELLDIHKPVWTFDKNNKIEEGDPKHNADHKWSYSNGLKNLSIRMAEGLDIKYDTHISYLRQKGGLWSLYDKSNNSFGEFAQVLVTAPATQTAQIVEDSNFEENSTKSQILQHLRKVEYNPIISFSFCYPEKVKTRPYYALVNTDKGNDISWVAWEHEKSQNRVPNQKSSIIIAQMGPEYSRKNYEADDKSMIPDVAQKLKKLIEEDTPAAVHVDVKRWKFALPRETTDSEPLNAISLPLGLAFCGDGFVGGRVHLALEHGAKVAAKMLPVSNL